MISKMDYNDIFIKKDFNEILCLDVDTSNIRGRKNEWC